MPLSIAAAAVTSLKVDPGASVIWIARLRSGWVGSALSSSYLSVAAVKSWEASWLGSKVGSETIARILPVAGSRATTAPCTSGPSACSPSNAAVWAAGSRVSETLPPSVLLPLMRSTRRVTNNRESLPDSTSFWLCSIPVWVK